MPQETGKQSGTQNASSLGEATRALEEVRDALRGYEVTALAGVAATLAGAAESLARTARELHEIRGEEWMDAEQARAYLGRRSEKQWERIAPILPRHYVTERGSSTTGARSMDGSWRGRRRTIFEARRTLAVVSIECRT